jgi:hypothetical protein
MISKSLHLEESVKNKTGTALIASINFDSCMHAEFKLLQLFDEVVKHDCCCVQLFSAV